MSFGRPQRSMGHWKHEPGAASGAGVTCMVKWFAECQVAAYPVIPSLKAPAY